MDYRVKVDILPTLKQLRRWHMEFSTDCLSMSLRTLRCDLKVGALVV